MREPARRLGISPTAISQIETGKSRPSVSTLYSIVTELGSLAAVAPLALAGAGATRGMVDEIGARLLAGDPVTAAQHEGLGW